MKGKIFGKGFSRQPLVLTRADFPTLRHAWVTFGRGASGLNSLGIYDAAGGAHGIMNFVGTGPGVYQDVSVKGPVLKYDNTGAGSFDSTRIKVGDSGGSGSPGGNVFSLLVLANIAASASQALYGANTNGVEFRISAGNKQELLKSGIASIGTSTTSVSFGVWQQYGVTYNGTVAQFYLNGVQDGSASSAQTFTHSQQYEITGRNAAASDNFSPAGVSYISLVAVFDSVLDPGVMAALSANPWRIFRRRKIYVGVSAGGGGVTVPASIRQIYVMP